MINAIKSILGFKPGVSMEELIAKGAQIIDVRSRNEYSGGHIKGSVNIPLDQLHEQMGKLKGPDHPIITCCASGMRSGSAKQFLKGHGFTNVHNGGSWHTLKRAVKK